MLRYLINMSKSWSVSGLLLSQGTQSIFLITDFIKSVRIESSKRKREICEASIHANNGFDILRFIEIKIMISIVK